MAYVDIDSFLKERARLSLLRDLRPATYRRDGRIYFHKSRTFLSKTAEYNEKVRDKKEYIDFSSNDYLGLSNHLKLIEASKRALNKFGTGSCASRLLSGNLEIHHRLEEMVAKFKNKEAALIFNSGYQANLGIISALFGRGDCIFSDRLNHASIIDGIILSGARLFRFQHTDVEHLESLLKRERHKFNKALIITETIFSMDGDRALLKELVCLKEKYDCEIFVDEAHATGIFGKDGAGVVEEEGLNEKIDFIMGTFSKALGSFGAYLATSRKIVKYLINTCRSFIYSTALPPAVIASNIASIELIKEEPWRRKKLLSLARYLREELKSKGFKIKGVSQIVPLIIGDNLKVIEFAKRLQEKGYWVLPIRPPTVSAGQARLRFSLTLYHDRKLLQRLINDISEIGISIAE